MPTIDEAIRLIQRRMTALQEVLAENKDRIDGQGSQALKRSLDAAQNTLNGLKKERDRRIDRGIHGGLKEPLKVNWPLKFKKKPK
jgi:predicted phage tail protein